MRLATYNVEWFTNLFDDAGALLNDNGWSGRQDVTRHQQLQALVTVFQQMDADAIMVIEAPDISRHRNGVVALETFAAYAGLRARRALVGFANDTQQEIMLLFDPDVIAASHAPSGFETGKEGLGAEARFDGVFRYDLDIDERTERITWSKPPLEVATTWKPTGAEFRLIGVHAKSKAPHGATNPQEVMRISIANRRKQLAQCIWLRKRVGWHLKRGEDVIVLGDFNDGPGLDEYEELFGRSSVEVVLGADEPGALFDPHAGLALSQRVGAMPSSSRFRVPPDGHYLAALLDYIMVSERLRARAPRWRIWHPFDNADCYHNQPLREALLMASDHFPVVLDVEM